MRPIKPSSAQAVNILKFFSRVAWNQSAYFHFDNAEKTLQAIYEYRPFWRGNVETDNLHSVSGHKVI